MKKILLLIFFSLIFIFFVEKSKKPIWNFDRTIYSGLVLQLDANFIEKIHPFIFSEIKKRTSEEDFKKYILTNKYCSIVYKDVNSYKQQLPFYGGRLLYLYTNLVFYKVFGDVFNASIYVNLIFYFLSFLIFFFLLSSYSSYLISAFFSVVLFCNSASIDIMQLGTPDIMALFFSLLFVYSLLKDNNLLTIFSIILLLFTRNDNIILISIFIVFHYIIKKQKISFLYFVIAILSYFLSKSISESYSWSLTYSHTFIELMNYPKDIDFHFGIRDYIDPFIRRAPLGNQKGFMFVFLLLLIANALYDICSTKKIFTYSTAVLAILLARFMLFPAIWDRFNFIFVLSLVVLFFREEHYLGKKITYFLNGFK